MSGDSSSSDDNSNTTSQQVAALHAALMQQMAAQQAAIYDASYGQANRDHETYLKASQSSPGRNATILTDPNSGVSGGAEPTLLGTPGKVSLDPTKKMLGIA